MGMAGPHVLSPALLQHRWYKRWGPLTGELLGRLRGSHQTPQVGGPCGGQNNGCCKDAKSSPQSFGRDLADVMQVQHPEIDSQPV
ncbi:hypothetical protein H8959_007023 [Pygathrix nigripes]